MPTIRKRGHVWQAIVRVKKNGVIIHQESKTYPREALAKSWAAEVEARIKNIGVPARQVQMITLGALIEKYAAHLSGIKPLRRSLEHELAYLSQVFKSTKLSELTSETFATFAMMRKREGAGPATVQHHLACIRVILNSAKTMFGIDVDSRALVDAMKVTGRLGLTAASLKRTQRVSDEVIEQLVTDFKRIADYPQTKIPMHKIVPLAVALPRRRTELCTALWSNYDKAAGTLKLLDTKHPTQVRNEIIPVPPAAAAIIDTLPVLDERILPYDPESISAAFERACARLGIKGIRFHDLRHEGISRLFEQGLAIQEVALISGHTSWSTLKRYTHIQPAQVLAKLNRSAA
jgi:hypothetical protein